MNFQLNTQGLSLGGIAIVVLGVVAYVAELRGQLNALDPQELKATYNEKMAELETALEAAAKMSRSKPDFEISDYEWDQFSSKRKHLIDSAKGFCFLNSVKQETTHKSSYNSEIRLDIDEQTNFWFVEGGESSPITGLNSYSSNQRLIGTVKCIKYVD